MMKKMMKGFTLAEVLTTLLVIGVVAALTIPALFNNTGERQYKAQYKKAVAVLEQAISLINTDSKCIIGDSEELAKCFNKEMKGNLTSYNGESGGEKNVIVSPDGAAYQFIYRGGGTTSLKDACGTLPARPRDESYYDGWSAICKVVIDLNGLDKGTTEFSSSFGSGYTLSGMYDTDALDQQVIMIYSNGVLPAYINDTNADRGYTWMYGDKAPY